MVDLLAVKMYQSVVTFLAVLTLIEAEEDWLAFALSRGSSVLKQNLTALWICVC